MLISHRSHMFIIGIIVAFSVFFYIANSRQKKGRLVIENTVSIRRPGLDTKDALTQVGGLPVYILNSGDYHGLATSGLLRPPVTQPRPDLYIPRQRQQKVRSTVLSDIPSVPYPRAFRRIHRRMRRQRP